MLGIGQDFSKLQSHREMGVGIDDRRWRFEHACLGENLQPNGSPVHQRIDGIYITPLALMSLIRAASRMPAASAKTSAEAINVNLGARRRSCSMTQPLGEMHAYLNANAPLPA